MKKYLAIIILIVQSCTHSSDKSSKSSSVDSIGFLYGFAFPYPSDLRLNQEGDRFMSIGSEVNFKTISKKPTNAFLLSVVNPKLKFDENHVPRGSHYYGYSRLNEHVISEIIAFGWNDLSMIDDVKFYAYLITHDEKGTIIDHQLIAEANNIDTLSFKEVSFAAKDRFMVIDYNFIAFQPCEDCYPIKKTPTQVRLDRAVYQINESGRIVKTTTMASMEFACKNEYNSFDGIFEDNPMVLKSNYWLIR